MMPPVLRSAARRASVRIPRGPRRLANVLLASLLLAAAVTSPVAAHEYWLAPSRYLAPPRQTVEVGALAGTGFRGEKKPFNPARAVRLVVRTAKLLDLAPLGVEGEYTWARFAPSDAGGALLAYESDFAFIALPAAEFDRYLELEGLDGPRAVRRRPGAPDPARERYRRCAKAWLAGGDASRAVTPVGMPLEIVPQSAPGTAPSLRVRVLWQGRPLAGALMRAWRAPLGADGALTDPEGRDSAGVAWQARTDARGEVLAQVEAPGEWLLSAVHMVPSADRAAADWESTWASLTFERPPERPSSIKP
jgi:hypothetical protein